MDLEAAQQPRLTADDARKQLDDAKCNDKKRWTRLEVRNVGNDEFTVSETPAAAAPLTDRDALIIPVDDGVRAVGKPRQELSAHAQIASFLRTIDFTMQKQRAGIPSVHIWLQRELLPGLLAQSPSKLSRAHATALKPSLRRFRATLHRVQETNYGGFVSWLERTGKMGGVGSLISATKAYTNHVYAFAQLIKVTKHLYVNALVVLAKIAEVVTLGQCATTDKTSREYIKRVRGIYGVFHRRLVPQIVYARAWLEYFGLRLHGTPFGPLLWYNFWIYYLQCALHDIQQRRFSSRDARKRLQNTIVTDASLLLDPTRMHQYIVKALRPTTVTDSFSASTTVPFMPGPPPEYSIAASLVPDGGWDAYTPTSYKKLMGTKPARLLEYTVVKGRLTTAKAKLHADPEVSVMFRFGLTTTGESSGLVDKPARRQPLGPPPQRAVSLFAYTSPGGQYDAHFLHYTATATKHA